jgi:hypothetical protein
MPDQKKAGVLKKHGSKYSDDLDEIMRAKFGDDF